MIQLTLVNEGPIWVNPFRITIIQPNLPTETIVAFGRDDRVFVREGAEEIADKCNAVFTGGDTIQGMIDKISK